jgi:hypothetical protein
MDNQTAKDLTDKIVEAIYNAPLSPVTAYQARIAKSLEQIAVTLDRIEKRLGDIDDDIVALPRVPKKPNGEAEVRREAF